MATIRERLIYAVELVTDKATQSVRGFRSSIAEAEGGVNKFKAGASSAMAGIQAQAGTLALAGGAALVAFGTKAVGAFQDTALAAGKFHDATGIAIEDGSRLLEVASDIGVSGETITAIVKKMNVEIGKGSPAIEELGISLQKTDDGAADVNATLLDTFKRIQAIEDPTKRAAAAQAIFGRGYAAAAELIFTNADQLQQKLAEVSDAKIITQAELDKAREFRDTMEDLKDVGEDLAVTTGQTLVPVLGDLAALLLEIQTNGGKAKDAIEDIPGGKGLLDALGTNLFELPGKSKEQWDNLGRSLGVLPPKTDKVEASLRAAIESAAGIAPATEDAAAGIDELGDAADTTTPKIKAADQSWKDFVSSLSVADALPGTFQEMAAAADAALGDIDESFADSTGSAEDFGRAIQDMREKVDFLGDAFDGVRDNLDLQDLLDDITEQFGAVADAQNVMTENGEQGVRDYNREVRDLRRELLELVDSIDTIPASKKVEIIAAIERGGVDELYGILGDLAKGVTVPVSFSAQPIQAFKDLNAIFSGGAAPSAPTFSQSNPAPATGGGGIVDNRQITIINPIGSTPTTQYIDQQTDYRRNGYR